MVTLLQLIASKMIVYCCQHYAEMEPERTWVHQMEVLPRMIGFENMITMHILCIILRYVIVITQNEYDILAIT